MPIYALGDLAPNIHPQTWIAPNASVIGQVQLEKNVSIWWGCTLRGDIDLLRVGENTNVQDGSVLHTDPGLRVNIGRDVTVGHRVILHGCTVGDGCLIGMGATLLNRSEIGKQCLIGANTLIPEGKVIPDRSLVVGAPGRIVRQLSDEEVERIACGTRQYVENWRRYQRELRPL
ncbi:MAG: gamma carbonic anhydrase family protein [Candidatus Accumulibacter sp.]|jgi:carbonic anhydrase/acetyltransferase-like protein (isoleucine patch superfamily)|nr:gamma carbonic anhydrase family protein [Accumulibacter sp.]